MQGEELSSHSEASSSSDDSSSEDDPISGSAAATGEVSTGRAIPNKVLGPSSHPFRARSTGSSTRNSGHSGSSGQKRSTRGQSRRGSRQDANEGGYLQLLSEGLDKAERALERDTEMVRLEKENRDLRELLGIDKELPAIDKDDAGGRQNEQIGIGDRWTISR